MWSQMSYRIDKQFCRLKVLDARQTCFSTERTQKGVAKFRWCSVNRRAPTCLVSTFVSYSSPSILEARSYRKSSIHTWSLIEIPAGLLFFNVQQTWTEWQQEGFSSKRHFSHALLRNLSHIFMRNMGSVSWKTWRSFALRWGKGKRGRIRNASTLARKNHERTLVFLKS